MELNILNIVAANDVIEALMRGSPVTFLDEEDREWRGTMRNGLVAADGTRAGGGEITEDTHVRITVGVTEITRPFFELVRLRAARNLEWR